MLIYPHFMHNPMYCAIFYTFIMHVFILGHAVLFLRKKINAAFAASVILQYAIYLFNAPRRLPPLRI